LRSRCLSRSAMMYLSGSTGGIYMTPKIVDAMREVRIDALIINFFMTVLLGTTVR
jgi:hypothetical protein